MLIKHIYAIHIYVLLPELWQYWSMLLENQVRYVFRQYCGNITRTGFVDSFGSIAAIMPENGYCDNTARN